MRELTAPFVGKDDLPYNGLEGFEMTTLTVTAKGQITLKQELLRHMNVGPGQKVEVDKLPDGRLAVGAPKQKGSIKAFSGSLAKKGTPRLTIEEINELTAKGWAGEL
jgi:antitoxin PrlF